MVEAWSWLAFFTDAGVPEGHCDSYADVFEDNRITEDMLPELDRDVLQAMGVAVMGDVIRILKHARLMLSQSEKDKVAAQRAVERSAVKEKRAAAITPPAKTEASTASRKRKAAAAARPIASVEPAEPEGEPDSDTGVEMKASSHPQHGQGSDKKKLAKFYKDEQGNVKQVRHVPPEHEGAYSIVVGKSRAQAASDKATPAIFSRLGGKGSKGSKHTDRPSSGGGTRKVPAVFSRLGSKDKAKAGKKGSRVVRTVKKSR
eukprot:m.166856 g.166856  ORF g.166856 m.166856 type:complete len:259 (-) comp24067_c0_seq1:408-1184(-)